MCRGRGSPAQPSSRWGSRSSQSASSNRPLSRGLATLRRTTFHRSAKWARVRPFFLRGMSMAAIHDKERSLQREISQRVESGLPGVEVLAVELSGPEHFCVYVDHATGVDHALCERVTNLLRDYLDRYTIDVSSPGLARPLRTR